MRGWMNWIARTFTPRLYSVSTDYGYDGKALFAVTWTRAAAYRIAEAEASSDVANDMRVSVWWLGRYEEHLRSFSADTSEEQQ